MDDYIFLATMVFLAALLFWQYGTKSGKDRLAKQKAEIKAKNEAKIRGDYVTSNATKTQNVVLAIILYVGLVFLVNMIFGTGYFVYIVLTLAFLIGCLFALIGLVIADIAERKGRSWDAFFWLSVLVSPILMWIIVATIKSDKQVVSHQAATSPVEVTVTSKLQELQNLLDSKLITEEEFEIKRKELLGRI
jgi:hypothetical protein